MNRRTYLVGAAGVASTAVAGCLGDGETDAEVSMTDDEHVAELRSEIDDRGVAYETVELEGDDIVEVEHGYDEDPNDAIANVAMAFVERIADEWEVERLEGHLRDEGNDWAWHAEAEWAREYADDEIDPAEYGERISETMTMVLDDEGGGEDEDEADSEG